jgi:hypothetical protein
MTMPGMPPLNVPGQQAGTGELIPMVRGTNGVWYTDPAAGSSLIPAGGPLLPMQQAPSFPTLQIPITSAMSALPIMATGNTVLTAIDSNSVRSLLTQSSLVGKELTPIPTATGRILMDIEMIKYY